MESLLLSTERTEHFSHIEEEIHDALRVSKELAEKNDSDFDIHDHVDELLQAKGVSRVRAEEVITTII